MNVTISGLLENFAAACRALLPAADFAHVPWQEGRQYDNWERMEAALFESLVAELCAEAVKSGYHLRFPQYGFRQTEPVDVSICTTDGADKVWRFVRLRTRDTPFDEAECVASGEIAAVCLAGSSWHLEIRTERGAERLSEVPIR